MRFIRISERIWASDDYVFFLDKTPDGWLVSEHGEPKNRFQTLNEAKAWTRRFAAGEVRAYSATLWYRRDS